MKPLFQQLRELYPELRFSMDPFTGVIEFESPQGRCDDALRAPIHPRLKVFLWSHNESMFQLTQEVPCL